MKITIICEKRGQRWPASYSRFQDLVEESIEKNKLRRKRKKIVMFSLILAFLLLSSYLFLSLNYNINLKNIFTGKTLFEVPESQPSETPGGRQFGIPEQEEQPQIPSPSSSQPSRSIGIPEEEQPEQQAPPNLREEIFVVSEESTQQSAEINRPVKWIVHIKLNKEATSFKLRFPKYAENIKVRVAEQKQFGITAKVIKEDGTFSILRKILNFFARITGLATTEIQEVNIEVNVPVNELEIEYETAAPASQETMLSGIPYRKQIKISGPDELHYTKVLAYTSIPETLPGKVIFYRIISSQREDMTSEIMQTDTNNDGRIDRLEWLTDLSTAVFEVEISGLEVGIESAVAAPWWNSSWLYRKHITVRNNNVTAVLENGYSTTLTFDSASIANAGKMLVTGNDTRIVWWNGTANVELDRFNEQPDLSGSWHFDENTGTTTNDESDYNNTGTLTNSPTWTTGKFSSALSFDGVNDYVNFASVPTTVIDNWSMEAWINPANLNQLGLAVSNAYDNGVTGNGYTFGVGNGAGGAGNKLQGLLSGVAWLDSGYTFPNANQWYHVVMLRTSGVTKFYVNGIQTPNTFATTPTTPTQFRVGSQTGIRFFNGTIDEVKIYNKALSASEISAHYNATSSIYKGFALSNTTLWFRTQKNISAGNEDSDYYLYYGNAAAGTAPANMSNIFVFFDYFSGTTIDTTKWVETDTGGYISQNNEIIITGGTTVWGQTTVHSIQNFTRSNLIAQAKYRSTCTSGGFSHDSTLLWWKDAGTGTSYADFIYALYFYKLVAGSPILRIFEDINYRGDVGTFVCGTQYWVRQILKPSGGAITQISTDDSTYSTLYDSSYSIESPLKVGFTHYDGGNIYIDDFKVRKYLSPEPSLTLGTEYTSGIIPSLASVILNSTFGTNTTSENLTCWPQNVQNARTLIFNWFLNSQPFSVLNMPFDSNIASTASGAIKDYSGSGNNGQLGGGTAANAPTWTTGKIGGAYNFDGVDDYVNVPDSSSIDFSGPQTISLWIKTNSIASNMRILSNEPSGYASTITVILYSGVPYYRRGNGINAEWSGSAVTDIRDNKWHHVVGIDTGAKFIIYVDDVKEYDSIPSGYSTPATTAQSLHIGNIGYDNTFPFNGTIDEVRIYNRALSASEVYQLYIEGNNSLNSSAIVSQELAELQQWKCSVTPNDAEVDGETKNSSILTISGIPPAISFVPPTPVNGTATTNRSAEINISITNAADLAEFTWNWNATNYTFYNDSLVLMMNFDNVSALGENATYAVDVSKYGNNGTLMNGAAWNSSGKYGKALSFDGVNDYVDAGNNASLNLPKDFSLEAWIKPAAVPSGNGGGIITKASDYSLGNSYNLFIDSQKPVFHWTNSDGTKYTTSAATTSIQVNTWMHLVVTKEGNTAKLYVNSILEDTDTYSGTSKIVTTTTKIGAYEKNIQGQYYVFNGTIDEVRIYNRSLSAAEIQQHYSSNLYKYASDKWQFYSNQTNLNAATYTYSASAKDIVGNENSTETRTLTVLESLISSKTSGWKENTTYFVVNDISAPGTAFSIDANNVTLDCRGYLINYSQSAVGYGVNITGYNFTTIKNCRIVQGNSSNGGAYGIYIDASHNNISSNNITTTGDDSIGIEVMPINNTISNNLIVTTSTWGAWGILVGSNNTISNNNVIVKSGYGGIMLFYSTNGSIISGNNINTTDCISGGCGGFCCSGILIFDGANFNVISNNNINGKRGISYSGGGFITITNNNISAEINGLYLSSNNNSVINNRIIISGSGAYGNALYLSSSSYNYITNNTIFSNQSWDFYSSGNSQNNTVTNLYLRSANLSFTSLDIALKSVLSNQPADSGNLYNIGKYINMTNNTAGSWAFVNISYSDADWQGKITSESTLKLYRFNASNAWQLVPGSGVNITANYVYGNVTNVTGFSIFAPLGNNIAPVVERIYPYGTTLSNVTMFDWANASAFPGNITNITTIYNNYTLFNATASDADNDTIFYGWYVDDNFSGNLSWLSWLGTLGMHNITVSVNDTVLRSNFTWIVNANKTEMLTCAVLTSCPDGYADIFHMSDLSNAHAELANQSDYSYKVCCKEVSGYTVDNNCSGPNKFTILHLSNYTNAHAEIWTESNYSYDVCLNSDTGMSLNCSYLSDCSDYDACVASISDTTNAHVADCITDSYANKICCSFAAVVNTPSQIQLNQPANDSQFNDTQNINFNFTATDDQNITLDCSIYLDSVLNQTNSSTQNGTLTNFLITGISYGSHNWSVNCSDGLLSNVSETRYFTIADTFPPLIQFVEPTEGNGSTISRDYILVNVTASDSGTGLANISIYLYNSTSLINTTNSTTSPLFANFSGLSEGAYYFNATAYDLAGNSNQTETRTLNITPLLTTCKTSDWAANTVYTLGSNVNNESTCMQIDANNVTLDCAGYMINYSQSDVGYAAYVNGYNFITIKNCRIVQGNEINSDAYGIYLYFANNGTIQNNTITTSSAGSYGIWIYTSSSYNTVTNNNIKTSSGSSFGIRLGSGSSLSTLIGNNVTTSGPDADGISVSSNSNIIANNNITTSNTNSYGIRLNPSSNSNITNNTITTSGSSGHGIYFGPASKSNIIANNNITTLSGGASALYIYRSNNSIFTNNTVFSNQSWDFFSRDGSQNNTVTNLFLRSANVSFTSLDIALRAVLIGQPADSAGLRNISKYINMTNNSAGSWAFVNISYADSDWQDRIINKSSLKLYKFKASGVWELVPNSSVNITANYVYGNVTSFSIFAPRGEAITNLTSCKSSDWIADTVYTLANDVSSNGTCMSIDAKNVTLDCLSYVINYSATITGYAINVSGYNFTTVRNCIIKQTNASINNAEGIRLSGGSDNALLNNSINTLGVDSHAIRVESATTTIANSSITTAGNSSKGIWANFSLIKLTSSAILTSGVNAIGIHLYPESNNSQIRDTIVNTTGSSGAYAINLGSSNNTLFNITASMAGLGFAVYLSSSHNNSIYGCNILALSPAGQALRLYASQNNRFVNVNARSGNWSFYSTSSSAGNIVTNLTAGNVLLSFTSLDIALKNSTAPVADPAGWSNISKYIDAINNSATSWLFLNISYADSDWKNAGVLKEESLKIYRLNATSAAWETTGISPNNVSLAANYVYGNITAFSVFAPFGDSLKNLTSCKSSLWAENTAYTLANNVNSSGTCMTIDANNVTLDCQGKMINYSRQTDGNSVSVTGYNYTIIKNCRIAQGNSSTSNADAISFWYANNGTIQNNNITTSGGTSDCIYLGFSNSNTLTSNIITTFGGGYGIWLDISSASNTLTNNNITTLSFGIRLGTGSSFSVLTNNIITISGGNGYGILATAISSLLTSNTITTSGTNGYGIYLSPGSNSSITSNNITTNGSSGHGIYFYIGSKSNTLTNNNVTTSGSGAYALHLYRSNHSIFTNNTVFSNQSWDFFSRDGSQNNTVTNLFLRSANVSFTSLDIALDSVLTGQPADSSGLRNISKYINMTNNSAASWAFVNISYDETDLGSIDESTLQLYRFNASNAWQLVPGSGVDINANYTYGNVTNVTGFSIFAPLGSVVAANTPPVIESVSSIPAQDPTEASYTDVTFSFVAYDADGKNDLNASSANATFSKTGETTRQNLSCSKIADIDDYRINLSCSIAMWYWDAASSWNVTAAISDNSAATAINDTTNFTYNELIAFTISPSALYWPSINPGDLNKTSLNFTTLTNTGNAVITAGNVRVKAVNIYGNTNPSYLIYAENFTASVNTGGSPPVECAGDALQNGSNVSITGSTLPRGNGTGIEQLYYCLTSAATSLIKQTYSTLTAGSWYIDVVSALVFIIPARKKKKLKEIRKDLMDYMLHTVSALRDKHDLSLEEISELIKSERMKEETIKIPLPIFTFKDLGPAESLVKYMKENLGMKFSEIARVLNRDDRTIWITYRNAAKKMPARIIEKIEKKKILVPVSILADRRLSILESIVNYLKSKNFANIKISKVLDKDPRNIYTFYARAKKKLSF